MWLLGLLHNVRFGLWKSLHVVYFVSREAVDVYRAIVAGISCGDSVSKSCHKVSHVGFIPMQKVCKTLPLIKHEVLHLQTCWFCSLWLLKSCLKNVSLSLCVPLFYPPGRCFMNLFYPPVLWKDVLTLGMWHCTCFFPRRVLAPPSREVNSWCPWLCVLCLALSCHEQGEGHLPQGIIPSRVKKVS